MLFKTFRLFFYAISVQNHVKYGLFAMIKH